MPKVTLVSFVNSILVLVTAALVWLYMDHKANDRSHVLDEYRPWIIERIKPVNTQVAMAVTDRRSSFQPYKVSVQFSEANTCIQRYLVSGAGGFDDCFDVLVDYINNYDQSAADRVKRGEAVTPNPNIEQLRLTLTNICRTEWSSTKSVNPLKNEDVCVGLTQGVAY